MVTLLANNGINPTLLPNLPSPHDTTREDLLNQTVGIPVSNKLIHAKNQLILPKDNHIYAQNQLMPPCEHHIPARNQRTPSLNQLIPNIIPSPFQPMISKFQPMISKFQL